MLNESKIRDSLTTQLHLIESGLIFEGIESPLKNLEGSGGRLDIYARDQFDHRVIIEIKRSDKSAREAIHELYKYISLFRETYGIDESEIRCILISTEWKELLLPFSTFVFDTEYEVSGYKLIISEVGSILNIEKISPLPKSKSISWREYHSIFFFKEESKRKAFILSLKKELKKISGTEFACIPMNYDRSKEDESRFRSYKYSPLALTEVVFPFSLYMAMTIVTPKYIENIKLVIGEEIFLEVENVSIEEAIQIYIDRKLEGKYDDWELGYNSKFTNMLHTWNCLSSIRIGQKITSQLFYSENDISENIKKEKGEHPWIYRDTISPKFKTKWEASKKKIFRFLECNFQWQEIMSAFLKNFDLNIDVLIKLDIYNPCNIIKSMYETNFNFENACIPELLITVEDFNGIIISSLIGGVVWNEADVNLDAREMIKNIFTDNSILDEFDESNKEDIFRIFVQLGQIREYEMNICRMHNLTYVAMECILKEGKLEEKEFLTFQENKLIKELPSESKFSSFGKFCLNHVSYINKLAAILDSHEQFTWEDRDYYSIDYFDDVQSALKAGRFINCSNIQPPLVQYGIGVIERADLVLQYLQSGEYTKEDKILRAKIIDTFVLLCQLEPQNVEKHLKLTTCVFGYPGLLNTEDKMLKKMWKTIQTYFDKNEENLELQWFKNLINALCVNKLFSQILSDGLLYAEQGLSRQEIYIQLNSDYAKRSTNNPNPSVHKLFELEIL
jgi:Endonuclease NucS